VVREPDGDVVAHEVDTSTNPDTHDRQQLNDLRSAVDAGLLDGVERHIVDDESGGDWFDLL
jgi:hypothetical protein